jgi:NDP-sugar pyrophosphorylase family protein
LEALQDSVDEIILVVGYKQDMIKKFVSENYSSLNVKYVEQKEQLGTGHAVSILESHIKDRFILLLGDNIYSKQDIKELSKNKYSILVMEVDNPEMFGVIIEEKGILKEVIEKPTKPTSNLISCGLFSFDKEIFFFLESVEKSERGEYELIEPLKQLSKKHGMHCITSKQCFQVGYPWDLLTADQEIRQDENSIGDNSKIQGNIKNSSIGNNCIIDGNVSNSLIMDNVTIEETSTIEDSIIGENVHFHGKIISKTNAFSTVKNEKIKVNRLGAIIADNVKAENVLIEPGCKVWPNKKITGKVNHDVI